MPTDPTLYATNQSFALLGKEGTRGTAATALTAIAVKAPQTTPNITWFPDEGLRGSPVTTYDQVAGPRYDTFDLKGDIHFDTWPLLVEGIMGGTDTVTGTTAPYTHTQGLLNSATTGSQPPSYTWQDFNGFICQQMTCGQVVDMTIDFTIAGALEFTSKYYGFIETTIGTPSLPSYGTTDKLVPSWSNAISIGGSSVGQMIDGSITIERSSEAVMTQGQQGPYSIFSGPMKVTGKCTLAAITADPFYTFGITQEQEAFTVTFTDPASTHTALMQMSKVQFMNAKYDRSKNFVQVTTDFEAVSNTTDATTGFAPIKFVTTNAVSAPS